MGLRLTRLDYEWYVPLFGGNRTRWVDGTDAAPLQVQIKYPSYAERVGALLRRERGPTSVTDELDFLRAHLGRVEGCELDGRPITTGRELVEAHELLPHDLLSELALAVTNLTVLEAGYRKNWSPGRGSLASRSGTDGTAASAEPAGSTVSAAATASPEPSS